MTRTPSTGWSVRAVPEAAWADVLHVDGHAFGWRIPDDHAAVERSVLEFDRMLGCYDDDTLVGVAGAYSLVMTVPGGPLPVAGVTWVGVLPTHRRRGVLTTLMRHQLTGLHEQEAEAVAALWASEPAIYGRFGYGAASRHLSLTIPRNPEALAGAPHDPALRLRVVAPEESLDEVASVYAHEVARRPGMPAHTSEAWQRHELFVPEDDRRGASPLRVVLAEDGDQVRGYARYATVSRWEETGPEGEVRVRAALATDPAAYAAIWRFLCDLDLTSVVRAGPRPLDDPLLEMLADPRRARPVLHDGLFIRLVDVGRALAARTYTMDVDVVLDVRDPLCPWNARRWHLTGGADGAACEPTDAPADITLSVTELGAAYLGGTTLNGLAAAGRVAEERAGAVRAASAAFAHTPLPWCPSVF